MSNVLQSAYKQFHSTETVVLKVHNGVTLRMDKFKVTALTLLDLFAAFDTFLQVDTANLLSFSL